MSKELVARGKFLRYVLRHNPKEIGIELDAAGWVDIELLMNAMNAHGHPMTRDDLDELMRNDDKHRCAISDDGKRIRANQGHSVQVELGYEEKEPPELLYHGTVQKFITGIAVEGLKKGSRHDVHLSPSLETAIVVGKRRGQPIILVVRSGEMHRDGFKFQLTTNGVWLTDTVPPKYIDFPPST